MSTRHARVIHVSIDRDWREVYAFAADPDQMPQWAGGLSATMRRDGDDYVADGGPIGAIRIRFAPPNDFGVIDHTVTLDTGQQVANALRVVPNGTGAEVMFLLLRQDDMDEDAFARDAATVEKDLQRLKAILESGGTALSAAGRTYVDPPLAP